MSPLSNIERMSEEMSFDYHQMQHFITESPWDARALMDQVAITVSGLLPKRKLTGLIIDESGWEKKGNKSVGVGRQYCGNVGKVANSQVAVFACLNNGDFASMVDARLYLPEDWCNNAQRCDEAGIPKGERMFKTKSEMALEMVRHQKELGASFDYVGGDGFYGHDIQLADGIAQLGYLYMLDIHSNLTIYLEQPELEVPKKSSARGRTPTCMKPTKEGMQAKDYMKSLSANDWSRLTVRNTTKGKLNADYHFKPVFIWDKNNGQILNRLLVIRRTEVKGGGFEYKYSFTNAHPVQYTPKCIAYMQAQRFFVEHSIKESKQILGLDQFQTRKWQSWQHQTALNFLVSSFILKEKLESFEDIPLISARDIKDLLIFKLYKQMTEEQFYEKMFQRHMRRQKDINNAYRRQEGDNLLK